MIDYTLELDDLESLAELRELALSDKELISLILDEDDINSLEELRSILDKSPASTIQWIGDFEFIPKSQDYPLLSIYRNNPLKTVFINTNNGWTLLVKDGEKGSKGDSTQNRYYPPGGGLGERDVVSLIDLKLSAYSPSTSGGTSFSGQISANNVLVDSTTFTFLSGTSAQDIFNQIDKEISSKLLLGSYQTNDIIEVGNQTDDIYVGKSDPDGKWYIRRVQSISEELIEVRHANISNNPTFLTYESALNSYATLDYRLLNELNF